MVITAMRENRNSWFIFQSVTATIVLDCRVHFLYRRFYFAIFYLVENINRTLSFCLFRVGENIGSIGADLVDRRKQKNRITYAKLELVGKLLC